jgi:hypothetical protein
VAGRRLERTEALWTQATPAGDGLAG